MYITGKYSTELTCFDINNCNILYKICISYAGVMVLFSANTEHYLIKVCYLKQVVDSDMAIYDA